MAADFPDPLTEGGPPPGAAWLNALVAAIAASAITVDGSTGLIARSGSGGIAIGFQETPELWVVLTYGTQGDGGAETGVYSWTEQIPVRGGGWTAGVRKGYAQDDPAKPSALLADPAFASSVPTANIVSSPGNQSVSLMPIVDVSRDKAVGRLTFRLRSC